MSQDGCQVHCPEQTRIWGRHGEVGMSRQLGSNEQYVIFSMILALYTIIFLDNYSTSSEYS